MDFFTGYFIRNSRSQSHKINKISCIIISWENFSYFSFTYKFFRNVPKRLSMQLVEYEGKLSQRRTALFRL